MLPGSNETYVEVTYSPTCIPVQSAMHLLHPLQHSIHRKGREKLFRMWETMSWGYSYVYNFMSNCLLYLQWVTACLTVVQLCPDLTWTASSNTNHSNYKHKHHPRLPSRYWPTLSVYTTHIQCQFFCLVSYVQVQSQSTNLVAESCRLSLPLHEQCSLELYPVLPFQCSFP